MRWIDILSSSLNNLLRRKLRSALTMLGVIIGTTAIIVTISLGYGAEKTQIEQMEAQTNLRMIDVSPQYGGFSGEESSSSGKRVTKITDSTIRQLRAIDGVAAVTPVVSISFNAKFTTGQYENENWQLTAVYPEDFAKMQKLKSGAGFSKRTDKMEIIMNEFEMVNFFNPRKQSGEWINTWEYLTAGLDLPLPDINWLRTNYTYTITFEDYENADANGDPKITTLDTRATMRGIIEADIYDYRFTYGAVVNLNWYRQFYKANQKLFKEMSVDYPESYENVYVLAESTEVVEQLIKDLNEFGVYVYSPLESINSMRAQIRTMQVFMGFIGAISMFVAALSIANTMMMSIYERTREIGVMKVLGCKLSNIRLMFLSEAAYIGIFGGMIGVALSYLLSYALNNVEWLQNIVGSVMSGVDYFGGDSTASIIPAQLTFTTWAFVIVISVASGFYPAQRAMQLSSLAAIRSSD